MNNTVSNMWQLFYHADGNTASVRSMHGSKSARAFVRAVAAEPRRLEIPRVTSLWQPILGTSYNPRGSRLSTHTYIHA